MTILLLVPTLFEVSHWPASPVLADLLEGPVRWEGFALALCGLGPVDAGVAASRYLADPEYELCVLAGLAGGFAERAPGTPSLVEVRSFVMEGQGAANEGGVQAWEKMDLPETVRGPLPVATREQIQGRPCGLPAVTALTVSACSGSKAVAMQRSQDHPDVQIEEMEGFAVARACRLARTPMACVRALSNEVGERDKKRWHVAEAMALLWDHLRSLAT